MLALRSAEHQTLEIGYIFHPGYGGQGFATETVRALVDLAFRIIGARRIIARVDTRNRRSCTLLERVGFRLEAHLVENEWLKGELTSEYDYGLLAREWPRSASRSTPLSYIPFVAAATPALFHLVHEALAVGRAGSLRGLGADPAPARIGAGADVLPGVDGGHRGGDHDDESEDAEEDQILPADSQDEQGQSGEEADTGEGGPTPVHPASAGAAHGIDQFRVLGCERSLHLLEEPLLLIREGHWPPPMGLVVRRCRSSRMGRSSLSLGCGR